MLRTKFVRFLMSILNWQVNSSSNFASFFIVMTHNSLVSFELMHFLLWIKGSNQSPNFETFEFSVENLPNYHVIFQTTSQFFFKLCFFSSNNIYFGQKHSIKVQIFGIFECSGQHSLNFSCQFWNNESIPLQIFHHSLVSLHITPL